MRYIGSNFDNFYAYFGHCPHLSWRRYCSIGSLERSQASEYHLVVFWAFFLLFVETILSLGMDKTLSNADFSPRKGQNN
jgi:hypothetical protein